MNHDYQQIIRQHCRPLSPLPTAISKRLVRLPDVRAVVFDVYGTLIISSSGDVGANVDAAKVTAVQDALSSMKIPWPTSSEECFQQYIGMIKQHQTRAREDGIEFPEVNIVSVWQQLLSGAGFTGVDWKRLALEYEVRANGTWQMPGLIRCLEQLREAGQHLGIISNAQFFTLELFPSLLGETVDELGFHEELQFYSYRYGHAKPGATLYVMAAQALERHGILPRQTLYVGNDMLNDILPARSVGFQTALFAGDRRSLRLREDDSRVAGVVPDVVITELMDIVDCV